MECRRHWLKCKAFFKHRFNKETLCQKDLEKLENYTSEYIYVDACSFYLRQNNARKIATSWQYFDAEFKNLDCTLITDIYLLINVYYFYSVPNQKFNCDAILNTHVIHCAVNSAHFKTHALAAKLPTQYDRMIFSAVVRVKGLRLCMS